MKKKKVIDRYKRVEKMKFTDDDWCPSYEHNMVCVSLITDMKEFNGEGVWHRVCVWGEDDCGMEKDFFGEDQRVDAENCFAKVINLQRVNRSDLKAMGFVSA